ncbi:MAG: ABC transporter ATP-binding protein, partial [Frankia sp.]|nr:ABC transporter ATP-binding protein [Frankia sp.]
RIAADHGCAVVLVEQYAKLALAAADDVVVLRRGRAVLRGRASELAGQVERLESAYFEGGEQAGSTV